MKRLLVLAFAAVLACSDATGSGPAVIVSLAGLPSPKSVYFRYVGQASGVVGVVPGSTVFSSPVSGDTTAVLVVAPLGQVLVGPIARVSVPDAGQALSSAVLVLVQLAASDYTLESTVGHALQLQPATP